MEKRFGGRGDAAHPLSRIDDKADPNEELHDSDEKTNNQKTQKLWQRVLNASYDLKKQELENLLELCWAFVAFTS